MKLKTKFLFANSEKNTGRRIYTKDYINHNYIRNNTDLQNITISSADESDISDKGRS